MLPSHNRRLPVFGSAEICSLWAELREKEKRRRRLECVVVNSTAMLFLLPGSSAQEEEPLLLLPNSTGFLCLLPLASCLLAFMIIVYITKRTRVSLLYANDWASIQRERERNTASRAPARCADLLSCL